jgi:hypothetical protein
MELLGERQEVDWEKPGTHQRSNRDASSDRGNGAGAHVSRDATAGSQGTDEEGDRGERLAGGQPGSCGAEGEAEPKPSLESFAVPCLLDQEAVEVPKETD